MKITDDANKVLQVLASNGYGGLGYYNFARIAADTGLERKQIRRICRYLCRKGLVQYGCGLWTEDGMPAGSGYAATQAGAELINNRSAQRGRGLNHTNQGD